MGVNRSGDRPDDIDKRLNDAADQVRAAIQPLLQTLDIDQQSDLWAPARPPTDDAAPGDQPAADGLRAE